jgi:hypothetical protein
LSIFFTKAAHFAPHFPNPKNRRFHKKKGQLKAQFSVEEKKGKNPVFWKI